MLRNSALKTISVCEPMISRYAPLRIALYPLSLAIACTEVKDKPDCRLISIIKSVYEIPTTLVSVLQFVVSTREILKMVAHPLFIDSDQIEAAIKKLSLQK
jgi:hypothetical protein